MADLTKVKSINKVIEAYFTKNPSINIVPAKELMPDFISAGIFAKDHRKGLPIRNILRALDKSNQLKLIPYIHAERKESNTYWYFIPSGAPKPTTAYKQEQKNPESEKALSQRAHSDETYVIDCCDKVLGLTANRQKRFDFLVGDLHKNGKTRTKLPVDAYYESLRLVIEYREIQHFEAVSHFDKPHKKTISGVTRDEQRKKYDKLREELLPQHDINLVVIPYSDFSCDTQNKIIRNEENDIEIVRKALKEHINME